MYPNPRRTRTHVSDYSVIRDVMMETCDLCVSVLHPVTSQMYGCLLTLIGLTPVYLLAGVGTIGKGTIMLILYCMATN
jgi:hypothetical protein